MNKSLESYACCQVRLQLRDLIRIIAIIRFPCEFLGNNLMDHGTHPQPPSLFKLRFGIMPGWHSMENGYKQKRGKKGKPNGKQPPAGRGPKNVFSREFPFFHHFRASFCPCAAGGSFPFGFPFFPHFQLLAVFHAMQAPGMITSLDGRKRVCLKWTCVCQFQNTSVSYSTVLNSLSPLSLAFLLSIVSPCYVLPIDLSHTMLENGITCPSNANKRR